MERRRRLGARSALAGALAAGGGALVAALLAISPPGERLERGLGQSTLYRLAGLGGTFAAVPQDALIIGLDRASVDWLRFEAEGIAQGQAGVRAGRLARCLSPAAVERLRAAYNVQALPRGVHACLLARLQAAGAGTVVFDLLFARKTPEDDLLAAAMAHHGQVLLFERIDPAGSNGPPILHQARALFRDAAAGSGPFLIDAPDGRLHGWVAQHPDYPASVALPDLAVRLARPTAPPAQAGAGTRQLRLYGPPGTLPVLTLAQALADGPGADPIAEQIAGRTVFVGAHAPDIPGLADHFAVSHPVAAGRSMPGVEIMATAFLNRLRGEELTRPGAVLRAALVGGFAATLVLFAFAVPGLGALVWIAGTGLLWLVGATVMFAAGGLWLPLAVPLLAVLPVALFGTLALRHAVARSMIERLVPAPLARRWHRAMSAERQPLTTEQASLLLCDLRGSTELSSALPPDDYAALIDRYYDLVSGCVAAQGGLVVEFQGDGVLCLFPESVSGADHGARALAAAHDIRRARDTANLPGGGLRLSQHSGAVSTGDVGARERFAFKALGDAVSLTFAVERFGREVLGHQEDPRDVAAPPEDIWLLTAAAAKAAGALPADIQDLGPVVLPGRKVPVPLIHIVTQ